MENFLFSLNVTFPVFLVMVIGWFLKQKGMLNDNFVTVANKFNFSVTLPFMVFRDLAAVDIYGTFDLKYVLFCAIASSICFWVIWGLTKLLMKDKTMRGAFVQASFRSSAAVMGLAFIDNIYGSSAMGPMMIIGAVPLYNIYSVLVLTFEAQTEEKDTSKIRQAAVNIIKNPIIISIFLGVIAALLKLDFPVLVDKTIDNVAKMATPLALIAMGAGFKGREALAKMKPTIAAAFVKLVAQAAIFVPIAASLGFTGEKMIGILVMLAAPTTPSCYIMAKNMHNDGDLTASVVVTTTLLAAFTLTGWIFILKTLGYI
ncbi:MAG: AEC family transporter [Lachnospiraceae bacterium]|nr:AEC family transporter [Lachnospiraceae bacterium]